MAELHVERFRRALLNLFAEAFEGPAEDWVWFVSYGDPTAGVLGTLGRLTAEEASMPPAWGGNTVAGHAEHLRWSLAFAASYYRGEVPEQNWEQSWAVQRVDAEQWERLQAELREQFRELYRAIEQHSDFSDDTFLHGTMAIVPHAAYHLGAIRQLVRMVKESAGSDG